MIADPCQKFVATAGGRCDPQDDGFPFIRRALEAIPIAAKNDIHSSSADAIVAVKKRMVLDERKGERGDFREQVEMQLLPAKSLSRLCERGVKQSLITDPHRAAKSLDENLVQGEQFFARGEFDHARRLSH